MRKFGWKKIDCLRRKSLFVGEEEEGLSSFKTLFRSLNKVALKESEYILYNIHLNYPGRLWSHLLYVEY